MFPISTSSGNKGKIDDRENVRVLFALRGKKYNTVKEALAEMHIQKLMQLLGMKE